MSRNQRDEFTTEQIIGALDNSFGIYINAAKELGIHRETLRKWVESEPELLEARISAKEASYDFVEHKLLDNIKQGKELSLIWFSKTQMRNRGYMEKQDIQITSKNINIQFLQEFTPNPSQPPIEIGQKEIQQIDGFRDNETDESKTTEE